MSIDARTSGDGTVLVVHGSFDRQDLAAVDRALAAIGPGGRVRIDLHEARACDDAAVAMLVRELQGSRDVEVVGLSAHHHRLLRYMGVRVRVTRH
jgi:hypothetical protein